MVVVCASLFVSVNMTGQCYSRDPPRRWFPNGMYPGTAFTRSIGDAGDFLSFGFLCLEFLSVPLCL
jgi:hypothetical protein